jgi:hypothetical protein
VCPIDANTHSHGAIHDRKRKRKKQEMAYEKGEEMGKERIGYKAVIINHSVCVS